MMGRLARYAAPFVAVGFVVGLSLTLWLSKPAPAATPTHTVNVFLDGINHGDFRQACSVQTIKGASMHDCGVYYATIVAQAAFFGGLDWYRVVPHSVKTWTQTYRGREVKLATVDFKYAKAAPSLRAHLRWIDGRGWTITWIG